MVCEYWFYVFINYKCGSDIKQKNKIIQFAFDLN